MVKTSLISIRVDTHTLHMIDGYVAARRYLTRSAAINNVLKNVIECSTAPDIDEILHSHNMYDEGYTLKIHRKQKINTPQVVTDN